LTEKVMDEAYQQILPYLPGGWRELLASLPQQELAALEELRLKPEQPVLARFHQREAFIGGDGYLEQDEALAPRLTREEFRKTVLLVTDSSFYALEEELRRGYITLPGGHRAGITGRAVLEKGVVRTLREISGINMRLARHIPGLALPLLPWLFNQQGDLQQTLLVAPPRAGKTTMLRDIACLLSAGAYGSPLTCGIVDERSELAALRQGLPQLPIGLRSDVLDGCPKAEGLMMLLRSMSPQVLICDEIGRPEDVTALQEAAHAGVRVIASAHGADVGELTRRPALESLLTAKAFTRIVFLSRRLGPGTIEAVVNEQMRPLFSVGGDYV
ncbi:MAG: stage III sporulation protein AA, partial [Clostridiales bacterium]